MLAVVGITSAVAFFQFYGYAAREGLLGPSAQFKYAAQADSEYGVFLGGRAEIIVSIRAIAESPIIGHGSWAKSDEYFSMLQALSGLSVQQRAQLQAMSVGSGLIPTHSHLFSAWVEAGILGGIFWLFVLWLTVRVLMHLSQMSEVLAPLIAYVAFNLLWDVVFSPFGAERRLVMPYFIIVVMFAWEMIVAARRSQRAGNGRQ